MGTSKRTKKKVIKSEPVNKYVGTRVQVSVGNDGDVSTKLIGSVRDMAVILASAIDSNEILRMVVVLALDSVRYSEEQEGLEEDNKSTKDDILETSDNQDKVF